MDEFANILQRDYGLKPQGKSAPMSAAKSSAPLLPSSPSSSPSSIHKKSKNDSKSSTPILDETLQEDLLFGSSNGIKSTFSSRNTYGSAASDLPVMYDDVFGGPPKFAPPSYPPVTAATMQQATSSTSSQSYDDIFRMPVKPSSLSSTTSASSIKGSSLPVFDAPLYDDDIFGGVPGIRSANVAYDDVFSGVSTVGTSPGVLEDLLGVSDSMESRDRSSSTQQAAFDSGMQSTAATGDFDELLTGFSGSEPAKLRPSGGGKPAQRKSSGLPKYSHGLSADDPFNVLQSAVRTPAPVPDLDAFKAPARASGGHGRHYSNDGIDENIVVSGNTSPHGTTAQSPSVNGVRYPSKKKDAGSPTPNAAQTNATGLEGSHLRRNHLSNSQAKGRTRTSSSSPKVKSMGGVEASSIHSPSRRNWQVHDKAEDPVWLPKAVKSRQVDEFWISVEDVNLVTEPTAAPPPSRPPPLPGSKQGHTSRKPTDSKQESNQEAVPNFKDFTIRHESPGTSKPSLSRGSSDYRSKSSLSNSGSVFDELEEFATGASRARKEVKKDISAPILEEEMIEGSAAASASAIAMKEAMERARYKLQDREKEERERETRASRVKGDQEKASEARESKEGSELEEKERAHKREEKEREAKAIREREERERDEREKEARERRRKEREKEKEREREREREKDRIAVERATQEARERAERAAVERATAEARERAATEARERAAVERATSEARERAAAEARERAAVERATAEARERAAVETRERAAVERATAEARERAAAEAREKAAERAAVEKAASEARARAERAAVERAHAEVRERAAERAATEARERAERAAAERAAAAREQQRRSENDLEAFFSSSSRAGSAPRQRSPTKGASSDGRQSSKNFSTEGPQRSSNVAPSVRKVASTTSSADDWTSLFGAAVSTSGEFQEVEGESADRQRARWERHQRTVERATKALEEKNQRDLQSLREQAERQRAGETLDAEIKRWAAGKEGNLRALLSTLQYILWPECGWQAVSLTDLITGAAVKKVYRKATLCVHPDKVQQKGATIQQKYIAEKVFDLLKEAWNKFYSEELF